MPRNLPLYISSKILSTKKGSFSRTIIRLAVVSISISLVILILSFSILGGFKKTIEQKVFSLEGHIQLCESEFYKKDFGTLPVSVNSEITKIAPSLEGVKSINQFAIQRGVIHANNHVLGVMIKGYGADYDTTSFHKNMIAGSFIDFEENSYSRDLVISQYMADQLNLKLNDEIIYYFYSAGKFKPKKLTIKGVYLTHLEEFDQRMVFGDINLIRNLSKWNDSLTGGFEINIHDLSELEEMTTTVQQLSDYNLFATSIKHKYIHLFDWLNLLEQQVDYFLYIIWFIIFINIVSAMYIFIKERTNMIGSLKAFGIRNIQINFIFWFTGIRILGKGLFFGNLIGLGICFLQVQFNIIPLDPTNYYMDSVPVILDAWDIVKINLSMIAWVLLFLTVPVSVIGRITPIKSIKFD